MTPLSLTEVRFSDDRTLSHCLAFLNRASQWSGFDLSQLVQPVCNSDKEFTGFYSLEHHLGFTAFSHTLDESINSPFVVDRLPFSQFREWVLSQTDKAS